MPITQDGGGVKGAIDAWSLENCNQICEHRESGHKSAKQNRYWAVINELLQGGEIFGGLVTVQQTNGFGRNRVEGAGCLQVHARVVNAQVQRCAARGLSVHENARDESEKHNGVAHAYAVRHRCIEHVNHLESLEETGRNVQQ